MAFKVLADNGISISAPQDGAMYNFFANNQNVILDGIGNEFAVSYTANSLVITVGTGEAIISGRSITATETNTLTLIANSTLYICLRIDLTQTAGSEGMIVALTSQDLIQSGNLNNGGNVCDILLGTAVTGTSGVTSFSDKRTIQPAVIPPTSTAGQVLASTATGYKWADAFSASRKYCVIGTDAVNPAGWYKVATGTLEGMNTANVTFVVSETYTRGYSGIFHCQIRTSGGDVEAVKAKWLSRDGVQEDSICIVTEGADYTIYYRLLNIRYGRTVFEIISDVDYYGETTDITLYNSITAETAEPVASLTSSDAVQVIDGITYSGDMNGLICEPGRMLVRKISSLATNKPPANAYGTALVFGFENNATNGFTGSQFFLVRSTTEPLIYYRYCLNNVFTGWLEYATTTDVATAISNLNTALTNTINTRLGGITIAPPLTKEEYEALETKDANTLYLVKEGA